SRLYCANIFQLLCPFFFTEPATTEIYTLSLHDALPICQTDGFVVASSQGDACVVPHAPLLGRNGPYRDAVVADRRHDRLEVAARSEEHTSELQSLRHLVCRLLLEKKKHPPTHTRTDCTN